LGLPEVPVVFTDMTQVQARLSTLRHNRARGSEDVEQAIQVLRDLELVGSLDLAQTELGISDEEMSRLLSTGSIPEQLAGESYGNEWIPSKDSGDENGATSTIGHGVEVSMTTAAVGAQVAGQTAVANALTSADKEKLSQAASRSVYRVACTFSADDAVLVRRALGDKPAEKLLQLCLAKESVGV
jgi:hypothetical protein